MNESTPLLPVLNKELKNDVKELKNMKSILRSMELINDRQLQLMLRYVNHQEEVNGIILVYYTIVLFFVVIFIYYTAMH